MIQFLAESVIMEAIQAFGWAILKVATLGRYAGRDESDWFFHGAVGLAGVVAAGWITYRLIV